MRSGHTKTNDPDTFVRVNFFAEYITGSNSYMLSGDLATLLTGRYIEIKMPPLSFREFCEIRGKDSDETLSEYMKIGRLPYAVTMVRNTEKLDTYLEGIYNTVIVKDMSLAPQKRAVSTEAPHADSHAGKGK